MITKILEKIGKNISVERIVLEYEKLAKQNILVDITNAESEILDLFGLKNVNLPETRETINKHFEIQDLESSLFNPTVDSLKLPKFEEIDGYEFEKYIAKLLTYLNYSSIRVTTKSSDQGADILAKLKDVSCVIQVKHYKGTVTNKAVQEVIAAKSFYKAQKAIVITTGKFTKSAKELAISSSVDLWDLTVLKEKIDLCS